LAADPMTADGLAIGYANGPAPRVDSRDIWDAPAVEFRCRFDFGVAFTDWRSWVRNPGS
jgi:hypothetical protein